MSARAGIVRAALVAVGVGTAGFGALTLVTTIAPVQVAWVVVWLAAAVVIHDGLLVPALSVARSRLRAWGVRWARGVTVAIETGFMAFATTALFVIPEIWAQLRGNANPTVLQGDYAARLVVLGIAIAGLVLVFSWSADARERRRDRR
ncbi:hypothetical protein [Microbacterium mangrovi]|uniref:hypothetical protein n=1 Tax=Microbacterium mangrovi TaxID=1348253 RepID=UPI00068EFE0A|nr:hypothetical protein [Microbacterium mangrovi]